MKNIRYSNNTLILGAVLYTMTLRTYNILRCLYFFVAFKKNSYLHQSAFLYHIKIYLKYAVTKADVTKISLLTFRIFCSQVLF